MLSRRQLIRSTALAASGLIAPPCMSADRVAFEAEAGKLIDRATGLSVRRGLDYLNQRQADDGTFGLNGYARNTGIIALAGMAFVSSGSTPGRGRFGDAAERCLICLLKNTRENGFIFIESSQDQRPMYGHGFATTYLAELYGMAKQDDLRNKLSRAVRLIINSQNQDGGWRYQPQPQPGDVSVTSCQVMALRAAKNSGLHVPSETIDRALAFIRNCQNPDGGFAYMPSVAGESAFERSAAAVIGMTSGGVYNGDDLDNAIKYISTHTPTKKDREAAKGHFYYGLYYAAQVFWQRGGKHWLDWYESIRKELLSRQRKDGSWPSPISPEYATAMATIVLQIPNNFLPIFQR